MILSFIVAMSQNRVIGVNNQLPWHLPEDLKRFRKITAGHPVIMGRKTLESIGRLLPGRENVVITRDKNYWPGFLDEGTAGKPTHATLRVCHSLEEALSKYENLEKDFEVFILGGGEIFAQSLNRMQRLYLTLVEKEIQGDAYFPPVDLSGFKVKFEESHMASDPTGIPFKFIDYEKSV